MKFSNILTILLAENCAMAQAPPTAAYNDAPQPTCEETCRRECEAGEVTTPPAPTPEVETPPPTEEGKAEEEVPSQGTEGDNAPPPTEEGKEETLICMGAPVSKGKTCATGCDYEWCKDAYDEGNEWWTCVPNGKGDGCMHRKEKGGEVPSPGTEGDNTPPPTEEGKEEGGEVPSPGTEGDNTPPPTEEGKEEEVVVTTPQIAITHPVTAEAKAGVPEQPGPPAQPKTLKEIFGGGGTYTPPVSPAQVGGLKPNGGGGTYGGKTLREIFGPGGPGLPGQPGQPQIRGPPPVSPARVGGPKPNGGGGIYGPGGPARRVQPGQPPITPPVSPARVGGPKPNGGGGIYAPPVSPARVGGPKPNGGRPGRPGQPGQPGRPSGGGQTTCRHTTGLPNKEACLCKGQNCGVGWQCSPKSGCKKGNGTVCTSDSECFWNDCKKMPGMPSKCC